MSDLSSVTALRRTAPQLPVHWYFDPRIHEIEQRLLFDNGPGYVGHELMVPNAGDYHALSWTGNAQALVRNARGVELLSNICRHRQAVILKGRGNAQNIICPLHRWTYGLDGKLLGAPHFADTPCLDLARTPLTRWNGLLFSGKRDVARDLAGMGVMQDLDFSGYMLDRVEVEEYACNWKTFTSIRGSASSSTSPTCVGNSATGTACRPAASRTDSHGPAARSTDAGTNRCCVTEKAGRPRTARSG